MRNYLTTTLGSGTQRKIESIFEIKKCSEIHMSHTSRNDTEWKVKFREQWKIFIQIRKSFRITTNRLPTILFYSIFFLWNDFDCRRRKTVFLEVFQNVGENNCIARYSIILHLKSNVMWHAHISKNVGIHFKRWPQLPSRWKSESKSRKFILMWKLLSVALSPIWPYVPTLRYIHYLRFHSWKI